MMATPAQLRKRARQARRAWAPANKLTAQTLQDIVSGKLKVKNGKVQYPKPKTKPPVPPPGYYDPALEAQRRASQRGLGDLMQDTELGGARAAQDYTFGVEGLGRERDRGYQDVDRQVEMLTRDYGQLARQQGEGARVAGVLSGGLALKAAQMRAENMAFDKQPLDTARTRIGEDYSTGVGRLGVDFARGGVDRATGLSRARREDTQFGLDIGEQERFQAIQAGWIPPTNPAAPKPKPKPKPKPTTGGNVNSGAGHAGGVAMASFGPASVIRRKHPIVYRPPAWRIG